MTSVPTISVIISTYNSEEWLRKVLYGFNQQTFRGFEVVIADDGSGPKTKELIQQMGSEVFFRMVHIWQEDDGFQKSRILNKAVRACKADYIIMTDGDCIPRQDFVAVHYLNSAPGYFISGGYYMLPMHISKLIGKEDIEKQNCFNIHWLKSHGIPKKFKNSKLTVKGRVSKIFNSLTPTNASWNGHNSSGWKSDILKVNGFDERMQYGGQDRELGERLLNSGIRAKQLRYSAVCVHLDHKRGYKTMHSIAKNKAIRKVVRTSRCTWTPYGIAK
ncbi:glycosyltransferase [Arenibacter aquaticus]|uniref:Glycosyltransferase n=1 Tax=Arenibacter aquaticus TaxID=2489054 RepID=A0A3S0IM69_9FLAO|nr:glycosyltransferase family 2 protein [Arenibacter aquaticus]RTE53232.1 glycosyltransferase [Arenibacter aquaticus]